MASEISILPSLFSLPAAGDHASQSDTLHFQSETNSALEPVAYLSAHSLATVADGVLSLGKVFLQSADYHDTYAALFSSQAAAGNAAGHHEAFDAIQASPAPPIHSQTIEQSTVSLGFDAANSVIQHFSGYFHDLL